MFVITKSQLKVFSAVCSNMVVVLLTAITVTRDPGILTWDVLGAMMCWHLAVKTEEVLEEL